MELDVEGNRIVGVRPDGSASPAGAYLCNKGRSAAEFHNGAEDRQLTSLARDNQGHLSAISADDAIARIGDQLAALVHEHGPRSVAFYHGTGAYRSTLGALMQRALRSALETPNFFSSMTIDQSAKWVTMGRMGVMASGKPRLQDVDLAVIVGNNPVVSHQAFPFIAGESGAPGKAYEATKARGMRMIVIDPRRTETARYADLFIQPLPGHDAAIFAAIAHVLLRDGTYNRDFCGRFVAQIEALTAAVAPFTPQLAAERAGVPVEQIEQAARWIGEARRPLVGSGSGPSFADDSNLADHMIEAVNALVGGYRRAGDPVRNPGTLIPRTPVERAVAPTRTWERGAKCLSADIGQIFGEFPTALLPGEILSEQPERIRALIVLGGNPLMALGDPDVALPAFQALDLLVCLDGRLNETGAQSHYVIATAQQFERADLTLPADGAFPEPFVQYTPAVLSKPAGLIEDWEFYHDVAVRMGVPLTFKLWTYGMDYDATSRGMRLDGSRRPTSDELIAFLCEEGATDFATLAAHSGGLRPQLAASQVLAGPLDCPDRLQICPGDVVADLASLALPRRAEPRPFRLTSRRMAEALNGAFREAGRTRRRHPVNPAFLNTDDMADLAIEDGALIEVSSDFGVIRAVARTDDRLRRGVVSMTHMFGQRQGSGDPLTDGGSYTGQLTSLTHHLQSINFMPRFSAVPVTISRVEQAAAATCATEPAT